VEGAGPRVKVKEWCPSQSRMASQRGHLRRTWVDHIKEDIAAPFDSLKCLAAARPARGSFRSVLCGPRINDNDNEGDKEKSC